MQTRAIRVKIFSARPSAARWEWFGFGGLFTGNKKVKRKGEKYNAVSACVKQQIGPIFEFVFWDLDTGI